jgi:arylsulfatase A-like enzyme
VDTGSRTGSGELARVVGRASLLWCALALVDAAIAFAVKGSVLHDARLSGTARAGLLFIELGALALLVAALCAAFLVLPAARLPFPSGRQRASSYLALAFVLAGAFATFFVLASWAACLATGRFADLTGLRFFAQNAVAFTRHVAHMKADWLVVGTLASLVLPLLVLLLYRRLEPSLERRTVAGLAALPLLTTLGAVSALGTLQPDGREAETAVFDPDTGVTGTLGDLYASSRDERAGPASRLLLDLLDVVHPRRDAPVADPAIRVVRSPILPIDAYRARVTPARRPNVVVLLVEALRRDELTSSGGRRVVMPTLEALAREGTTFTDAICQSSHSNYADPCPLSGDYPLRSSRAYTYPPRPTYPRVLVYDLLKAVGYRTALISSQDETWGGMLNYLDTGGLDTILHAGNYSGPTYVPRTDAGFTAFVAGTKRSGKIDDRFTVREAVKWIDSVGDAPFFLAVNLQSSHVPYETPADFVPPFPVKRDFDVFFGHFPRERLSDVRDLYSNSLAYVDAQISELVDHLKRRGLYDDTLIVATGDQGEAFFEHDHAAHAGPLFQEVLHIALVVRGPGVPAGRDDRPAQHIDLPPTILGLLGLPPHPAYQGADLFSPDRREDRARFAVAQSPVATQYAVLRSGYKLMVDTRRDFSLLFDLNRDPLERFDFSRVEPRRAEDLRRWLDTWRRLQVDYYEDVGEQTRTYPPRLVDEPGR